MSCCFFVSDLHGSLPRYRALLSAVERERPAAVFLGGDLLAHGLGPVSSDGHDDFIADFLAAELGALRGRLGRGFPRVFVILGNDDPRIHEAGLLAAAPRAGWEYVHQRVVDFGAYRVLGYANVPPTPFLLKDWERYDVSRYVDPGCVSPEEGMRSVPVDIKEVRHGTIKKDLQRLAGDAPLDSTICLFHSPPYNCALDRAALDGRSVDHVPLDVHVGSIAIQRFIEERQPLVTLHGHIHESARLTGTWRQQLGGTWMLSAAHHGPELALVRFDPADPQAATRELL
jgi:Icc-related predicted phosphoesterase